VREFVIAQRRHEEERDRDMRLAWHTAWLRRVKKFPELKELLARKPAAVTQSANHHMTMLGMLGLKGHKKKDGVPVQKSRAEARPLHPVIRQHRGRKVIRRGR
jgi:hypothetical protein